MSAESGLAISTVQNLYKHGSDTRKRFGESLTAASDYYSSLITFVTRLVPATNGPISKRLLDVGCGCGWSSFCFAKTGYQTTGVDLNADAFEPPASANLKFTEGSALDIPVEDETFDVVVTYQCLEHIPKPETALNEMVRVCRPGGVICVVGPNLVSPIIPLKDIAKDVLSGQITMLRLPSTPHHPYGNTTIERARSFLSTSGLLLNKLFCSRTTFNMRSPDTAPPFDGDNDACYLCNPTDLVRFFQERGHHILRNGKHDRPTITRLFAGGTWIAARKIN